MAGMQTDDWEARVTQCAPVPHREGSRLHRDRRQEPPSSFAQGLTEAWAACLWFMYSSWLGWCAIRRP